MRSQTGPIAAHETSVRRRNKTVVWDHSVRMDRIFLDMHATWSSGEFGASSEAVHFKCLSSCGSLKLHVSL